MTTEELWAELSWIAQIVEGIEVAGLVWAGWGQARTSEAGKEEQSPRLTRRLKMKSNLSGQETELKMPNSTNPHSRPDDTAPKYHSENSFILLNKPALMFLPT